MDAGCLMGCVYTGHGTTLGNARKAFLSVTQRFECAAHASRITSFERDQLYGTGWVRLSLRIHRGYKLSDFVGQLEWGIDDDRVRFLVDMQGK